jgi:hypothetical protein
VRVTARQAAGRDSGKVQNWRGTIAEWRGDTLVLRTNKALLTGIPLNTVSRLSVSRGRAPDPVGGALKGAGIGGGVGLALLVAACGEADEDPGPGTGDDDTCTLSDFGNILLLTGMLAVAGGAVGIVAGTIIGGERWQPLAVGPGRLSFRSGGGGGFGVGVALPF